MAIPASIRGQVPTLGPDAMRKVLGLLTHAEKVRLGWLLAAVMLMGFMDVIGVSSILPFMAVVAKPESVHEISALSAIYEYFAFASVKSFLFLLGVIALGLVLFSTAVSLAVGWGILRYAHILGHELSTRVLRMYLTRPYVFFLDRNSSRLTLTVTDEVEGVVNGVVLPFLQALARTIVAIAMLALIFVVDPLLASGFLLVVGGAYALVLLGTRTRVANLGYRSQDARHTRFRGTAEAFGGIKELILLGRLRQFFDRFREASREYARYQTLHGAMALVPRAALEAIAFGAILLIILYLIGTGTDLSKTLPLLALYALTGYRLMPAFQQIFQSILTIRFNWPSVELVADELTGNPGSFMPSSLSDAVEHEESPLEFRESLCVSAVSFTYPGANTRALERVSLAVFKNTSVGLVGATGSGKTTLVDIVLGLLQPNEGCLTVDGNVVESSRLRNWQLNLGYVPQQIYLTDDTIARNIAFGLPHDSVDMERVRRAARIAHLDQFVTSQLPSAYDTVVGERGVRLSGGQRQRIGIARALYHDPAVLVLDEATSALDGITENAIVEAIRELAHEKTIITIAHRLSTVQECDVIYLLEDGRIVDQGGYEELLARSGRFRAMAKVTE